MKRIKLTTVLFFTLITLTSLACAIPFIGGIGQTGQEGEHSSGHLVPGEPYQGVDNVSVGVVEGAIEATVPITIERLARDSILAELPRTADPEGDIYRITTETSVTPDASQPVIIALPVPSDAPQGNLALGLLVSTKDLDPQTEDDEGEGDFSSVSGKAEPRNVWEIVEGIYNEEDDLFLALLPYLPEDGRVVRLVSSKNFDSSPAELGYKSGGLLLRQAGGSVQFKVKCVPSDDDKNGEWEKKVCTEAVKEQLSEMAMNAYRLYVEELEFNRPRLYRIPELLSLEPLDFELSNSYLIQIRQPARIEDGEDPSRCEYNFKTDDDGDPKLNDEGKVIRDGPLSGVYIRDSSSFAICLADPDNEDFSTEGSGSTKTTFSGGLINHEFFHAIQYAYPKFLENRLAGKGERSFVEGTATIASGSTANSIVRSDRGVRDVDVGLFRGDKAALRDRHAYDAQDFFVYLADLFDDPTIRFLENMIKEGGNRFDVDRVLRTRDEGQGLPEVYWNWVKDQAFEKQYDLQDFYGDTCELSTTNSGNYYALLRGDLNSTGEPEIIHYRHANPPSPTSFDLQPLTSTVVQITFHPNTGEDYRIQPIVETSNEAVLYKFYDEADEGTRDCLGTPEQTSPVVEMLQGQEAKIFYVLIANTAMGAEETATIDFRTAMTSSACLVGNWQADNESYLALLQSTVQDVEDAGEFTKAEGVFGLVMDENGQVTNYSENFSITLCSDLGCLSLPVSHSGTAEYTSSGDRLTITGGQSVFAQFAGQTGSAQTEGGSARFSCSDDILIIELDGFPPLRFNRVEE